MPNSFFQFKKFRVQQDRCAMKVTTDACLFGSWVAQRAVTLQSARNILDIGAGTGLLSLMYAQKNPDAHIDAIEVDKHSYDQALENAGSSPFAERINLLFADAKIFPFEKKYDVIISNPPFYENEIPSNDERKNVAHHQAALRFEELLTVIKSALSETGLFYLLLPFKRNVEVRKILAQQKMSISNLVLVRPSGKQDFIRLMIEGKNSGANEAEVPISEISVWDEQQQYTPEFIELLQEYYLNM